MGITLYDFPTSGHAHRIRLFLGLLGIEYDKVLVDMPGGGHKTPGYLALSPLGQVPTMVDGDVIVDGRARIPGPEIRARGLAAAGPGRRRRSTAVAVHGLRRTLSRPDCPARGAAFRSSRRRTGGPRMVETLVRLDAGAPVRAPVARVGPPDDRRCRDVFLYPGSGRGRLRYRALPGRASLAGRRRIAPEFRSDAALMLRQMLMLREPNAAYLR
jgi:hypothetical protein